MSSLEERLQATIRDIPDFPRPGILFKDITPVLAEPELMAGITDALADRLRGLGVDAVVGIESRGFIFGAPLAQALEVAFVPARKPGKLPYETVSHSYSLEYGTNTLEMHVDALRPGWRVAVIDDLLATGGTAEATIRLVERLGGRLAAAAFVVELGFLNGRERLGDVPVESLVVY